MFYDNFVIQCNKIKQSPSAAAVDMGFHRSEVTRWSKGVTPRRANLQRMATYFDCTIEDLLAENKKTAARMGDGKSSKVIEFLESLPTDVLRGILVALKAPEDVLAELDQREQK